MNIDLSTLHSKTVSSIDITGTYNIDYEYYKDSDIVKILDIKVDGYIYEEEEIDKINCKIKGEMILNDSISLEEVNYPFSIEYDDIIEENCKISENLLDIFMFLWENIVLEVPLQFTKVSDLSKFHGDGWRLMSEDDYHYQDNPFTELLKDYDKE